MRRAPVEPVPPSARAARRAVLVVFAVNGLLIGSWAARIPAVRQRLALSDGELGLALAGAALGAILAMPLAGALSARRGSRPTTRAGIVLACAALALVALAPSLALLCAGTVLLGMGNGTLDVAMNAHGVAVERRHRRPILAGLHAAFSVGGLVGSGLGALAAVAGVDARIHLAAVGAAGLVVGLAVTRRFLPPSADATGEGEPWLVAPGRRLWALGALAFACLLLEGASADWSGVYLRDELGASAGLAALGFTAFSATMIGGRLAGDGLVGRLSGVVVVRAGGLVAAVGFGLALLAAAPGFALAGFACLGIGMAGVVPIVFRAAGTVDGLSPGVALAAVSSTGYAGFLVGPPAIGGLAQLVGLSSALALLVVLAAGVAALAGAAAAPA